MPLTHDSPRPQAIPHWPQSLSADDRSTQMPRHTERPSWQIPVQAPPMQHPGWQLRPQAPQ
jgi:hypothetical protein